MKYEIVGLTLKRTHTHTHTRARVQLKAKRIDRYEIAGERMKTKQNKKTLNALKSISVHAKMH